MRIKARVEMIEKVIVILRYSDSVHYAGNVGFVAVRVDFRQMNRLNSVDSVEVISIANY